jgi:hypothetical protein
MYIVTVLGRSNVAPDSENGLHKAIYSPQKQKALMKYKSGVNITLE